MFRMVDSMNRFNALWLGTLSAATAYAALDQLVEVASAKLVALQHASPLTENAYETTLDSIEKITNGDFYIGLFVAATAGLTGMAAMYNACRGDKK